MRLAWAPRALHQLEHAFAHIAVDNPAAAWRIYDRITSRADELIDFPELGPAGREPDTRELVVLGTEYVIVYRLSHELVEIAAVWHGRQSRK
jgi:plasmid stabilization system protein ParE